MLMVLFYTKNLNQRFYNRLIQNVLLRFGVSIHPFLVRWNIKIYSTEETPLIFFEHIKGDLNPGIPSGITGKFEIKLYLYDENSNLAKRLNSDRVQHELCHAILYDKYKTKDRIWVNGVHNHVQDRFQRRFWYWQFPFWRRFQVSIIDIRYLL